MPTSIDWFVITKKAVLMQRLADLVRSGHKYYVEGQIAIEKAGFFAGKLDELYRVGQDKLQASRQRKKGEASFRLLMLKLENEEFLRFWLLRTEGTVCPEATREKWRDAWSSDRIVLTGYELVRQTREGAKNPAWTWRYNKEREQDLRNAILQAIRTKRDDELRQLIQTIWRTPGFAAAREQVKKMRKLIEKDWVRSRGTEPLPEIPDRLGYVRRLPDMGMRISELDWKVRSSKK